MYDIENPEPKPITKEGSEGLKFIVQIIVIIVLALGLAFISLRYFMQAYEVDGASMETTLQNGDRLVVWKGSKTWSNIRGQSFIPERYDVVVFDRPRFIESNNADVDHLIKRVIGLPGDRVEVKDNSVTIYNDENPNGFNPDENQEYAESIDSTPGEATITVGEDEIFVLGDNRTNSLDSRRFGAVNVVHLTGIAEFRIAPVNNMNRL